MPKGNRTSGRNKEFIEQQFKPVSDVPLEPLSKRDIQVKVGQSVYDYLMTLPQRDRINLVRKAIDSAVEAHKNSV
jgi:hypothetical protein